VEPACAVEVRIAHIWYKSTNKSIHVHAVHQQRTSPLHGRDSLVVFRRGGQDRVATSRENVGKVHFPEWVLWVIVTVFSVLLT
jgi:hypothetical protein